MHTLLISLSIILITILTFVTVRPISELEQTHLRQRRQQQKPIVVDPNQENSILNNHETLDDIFHDVKNVFTGHKHPHLNKPPNFHCTRTKHVNGSYIEHCIEHILNEDGTINATRTTQISYTSSSAITPLHRSENSANP